VSCHLRWISSLLDIDKWICIRYKCIINYVIGSWTSRVWQCVGGWDRSRSLCQFLIDHKSNQNSKWLQHSLDRLLKLQAPMFCTLIYFENKRTPTYTICTHFLRRIWCVVNINTGKFSTPIRAYVLYNT